ncbi:complement C1r-A subcomponent-like isoform X1 [Tachysurus fulvidraco]|uniref:complement C1r-A subcomponent-like isoform X1 n=1 Tax=Tachysurus fulvidraco TaxID=1234273 RepID=UPI000F507D93|nr:complement C1r-A subcomponent-like isoform X1 [Tachysurus fulvidraco]
MDLHLKLKWLFIISINLQIWSFVYMSVMYGELHSPNYPEHYPAPLYKHWDLEVPLGYHIQINFNYLNIKPSQGCGNDSLTISYKEKVMKYCGDKDSKSHSHPGNSSIFIPTAKVKLSLRTNEVNQGPTLPVGFSAFYQAKDRDECSSQVPPCTQICLNTMGSYLCACYHGFKLDADQRTCVRIKCESPKGTNMRIIPVHSTYYYRDVISAQCDTGYKIIVKGALFNNYTSTCQSNGQWSLPLLQCHIIHCKNPPPLLNGEVLFISGAHNQYQSVIKLHCNRPYVLPATYNVTYACHADMEWKDDQNSVMSVTPKCVLECGHPLVGLERHKRVLGGHRAPQRAFPWYAFISPLHGGGTIIAEKWILTAANVISNQINDPTKLKVYVGVTNIQKLSKLSHLQVKSLHIHPLYNNPDGTNYDNDIALIQLEKPILYNADVMPLCLPSQDTEITPGVTGWVSGFGQTERSALARFLRYTSIPLVEQKTCQNFVDKVGIPVALTENMFCAGVPEGGKDTCEGDGGGSLVLKKDGVFWATGIASWGHGCGIPGRYGVYTQVSRYTDWINKIMSES